MNIAGEANSMDKWVSTQMAGGIHAFTGGSGSAVVLISGWPETAEAYEEIFPLLAARHSIICMDPPGLGDSAPSEEGYDTSTVSRMMAASLRARTGDGFHLVGHDIGAWIAYAWAAQFPAQVRSLTVLDSALPGLAPPMTYPLPVETNVRLWQFSFNTLPDLPEILTKGRERELLDWLIANKSQYPERISPAKRERYAECYARPGGMSRGFGYYRATPLSASQNAEFSKKKLGIPVLALGGSIGMGEALKKLMEPLAFHVEGGAIEDCGHYVMEEQPEVLAARLMGFFMMVETGTP